MVGCRRRVPSGNQGDRGGRIISAGDVVICSRASSSKRRAQLNPPSGWFQSMRCRLWTTLPLATMRMPRSTKWCELRPELEVILEWPFGIDR